MKYANKSSATRAAQREVGGEWETKAAILVHEEGGFVIVPRQAEAPTEVKQNLSLAEALEESGETIDELKDNATGKKNPGDGLANKQAMGWRLSTCDKPTKKVWHIADSMPGASRKEVIAACEAAGIGAGTSRTQYQAWFTAMKSSGLNPRA
jgi:hypothetical protein